MADAQQRQELAAERARLAAQERQQAHARERVAERFRTIAKRREASTTAIGRATPEALRKGVDAYTERTSTPTICISSRSSANPRWRTPWRRSSMIASASCNAGVESALLQN